MIQSGLGIKDEGVVLHGVEIDVLLEAGNQHPIKRESQQDGKRGQDEDADDLSADAPGNSFGHQVTSIS
jgi:hypothetical protein